MFNQRVTDDFSAMVDSLRFKSSFEPATPLVFKHIEIVQRLLKIFIENEPLIDKGLAKAVARLPEENLARLLTSPYLCELLMISTKELEPVRLQIVQALVAEVRYVNPGFQHPLQPNWTIDGDVVLNAQIAQKFPSLRTACGIRLNYQSAIHNTGKEGIGGYTYDMALSHLERLETGLEIVESVSSSARSLVRLFTTTIQLRQNRNCPNVVNSSTHTSIGLIRSDNFHSLHEDMPEVVDMLVHESIHQYLHLFEEQLFPFVHAVPKELLDQRLFASPWSGNLLDLRSYTHAILVWYGLWNFWGSIVVSGYSHPEISQIQAQEKQAEAAFGFENSRSVLDNLSEARPYLDTEYVSQVERLQLKLKKMAEAV